MHARNEDAPRSRRRCTTCGSLTLTKARFCAFCGQPIASYNPSPRLPLIPFATERRHLTVMFLDLVGSSALATRLDTEDFAQVIQSYHRCLSRVVSMHGGFIARYMGDGLLAYFGYPQAHEDDAERAVACALAAVEAAALLDGLGHPMPTRVGIATGMTVVGDVVGLGQPQALDIAGEAPNLASRLQGIAAPNTVVVADEVRSLLGSLFLWRDCGRQSLKGWDESVQAWQALSPARLPDRFRARQARLGPLVGREHEALRIAEAWRRSGEGSGQVVLLRGDPGLGKSRLIAHIKQATGGTPHVRLQYFCTAHQQGTALHPCVQQIEYAANIQAEDDPATRLEKLRGATGDVPEAELLLIASLLQIALPPGLPASALQPMSPHAHRKRLFDSLLNQLRRLAEQQPVLAIVEDAHWSDPTSVELLDRAVRRLGSHRALLVVTARPEFRPAWANEPHVETLDLRPLDAADSHALVHFAAAGNGLPASVVSGILARADGVPLYLEELTRTVIQSGMPAQDAAGLLQKGGVTDIPTSLYALLIARLDRLEGAREVAEVASAVGRDFDVDVLARVTGWPAHVLQAAIAQLAETGLILPGGEGQRRFRFKHVLLQDAAYGTMVRSRRRELHGRIARVLEEDVARGATTPAAILAHHFTEAGMIERALAWWLRAGVQSLQQYAASEAMAQLKRGLELFATLPVAGRRATHELDLQTALAKALLAKVGWASQQTGDALQRAREICDGLQEPPQRLSVQFGQWTHTFMRARLDEARRQAEDMLAEGERSADPTWIVMGCYALGYTAHSLGEMELAREKFARGIALFDPARRDAYGSPVVGDPRVMMRCYDAWAARCLGQFAEARRVLALAQHEAQQVGQLLAVSHVLNRSAHHALMEGSHVEARATLGVLRRIVEEHGIDFYGALCTTFEGWAVGLAGDPAAGLAGVQRGIAQYHETGTSLYLPSLLAIEAELLGRTGAIEEGLACIERACALAETTAQRWDEAELERIRGDLLRSRGLLDTAETAYRRAVRLSQQRGLTGFELRAATALAELIGKQGRSGEATAVLRPVCAQLSGETGSRDLDRARAVLASLPHMAL